MAAPVQVNEVEKYTTATWELGPDDEGEAVNFSEFADKTVQAYGDFEGGTVTVEGSMNGSVWQALTDVNGDPAAFTEAGMLVLRENPRSVRVVSSDTADLDVTVIIGAARVL